MKTTLLFTLLLSLAAWNTGFAAVTGRSADTSLAGTEKLLSDSSGVDTFITVTTLRDAMVLTGGLTASGSTAFDFSGSTGAFKTSTGIATFGGSAHNFSAVLQPTTNDAAALGTASLSFSDLFLASGAVLNINNGNWVATHTSGILTVGTGDLRISTAGTNAASVVLVGGTQTLTNKTLTSPTINTATLSSPTMTTPTLGAAIATSIESLTSGLIYEGATADAFETTLTVTDPTADRTVTFPNTTGTVVLAQTSTTTALTADNQVVVPGSNGRLQLTSDNATAANRTFTLSASGAITGQIYVIIGPATNAAELADTGIQKLSAAWTPGATDALTVLFDGTNFIELSRADN